MLLHQLPQRLPAPTQTPSLGHGLCRDGIGTVAEGGDAAEQGAGDDNLQNDLVPVRRHLGEFDATLLQSVTGFPLVAFVEVERVLTDRPRPALLGYCLEGFSTSTLGSMIEAIEYVDVGDELPGTPFVSVCSHRNWITACRPNTGTSAP